MFFGAVFGYVFFNEPLSLVKIAGILLIFGGVLLISTEKEDTEVSGEGDGEELVLLPVQSAVRVERQPHLSTS